MRLNSVKLLTAAILLIAAPAWSGTADPEIDALLEFVGSSGCTFIRNGSEHPAADAEDHLRMKYRRGKRYVKTAEDFIARIASESSWTGRPYRVECPGLPPEQTANWLTVKLRTLRENNT